MASSNFLKVAVKAARAAGKIIRQNYGKHLNLSYKTGSEMVTDVDVKAEEKIKVIISKYYPTHSIYAEESGYEEAGSEYLWIVDPLDGTTNYTMGNPFFNTSIALVKNGEIIMGVVYNPIMDELFHAEKDKGAYLNGNQIFVNDKSEIRKSIITFCHGSKELKSVIRAIKYYSKVKLLANHTRQLGAAALELAYVACGRTSCFFMNNLNSYDVAAGAILVKEAGGDVTDFNDENFKINSIDILASNSAIHVQILKFINSIDKEIN